LPKVLDLHREVSQERLKIMREAQGAK
jgi:hypothetical protein